MGHSLGKPAPSTLRIFFQNVDSLPQSDDGEVILTMIQQFIKNMRLTFFGFMEANTCWNLIEYDQCLMQETWGWWDMAHWSLGFNQQDKHKVICQPSGTGVLSLNGSLGAIIG